MQYYSSLFNYQTIVNVPKNYTTFWGLTKVLYGSDN